MVVGAALLASLLLAACGSKGATPTTRATTTTQAQALCPLTGTPAPGGVVPQRPALAIKVDNYGLGPAPAEARPQSGLDYADIVFEEQVEGSITRYAAVFQCRNAVGLVGPVRSARWTDVQMLSQLGHPILVHVGGIIPVINYIDSSPLVNFDLGGHPAEEVNPPGRVAPYDTYTTTAAVWAAAGQPAKAPSPIFTYSSAVPSGPAVSQVNLDWSYTSDIYWRWDAATGTWLRFYNVDTSGPVRLQADTLADGVQNQAQNVVVLDVNITYGPWVENSEGGLEAESHLIGESGTALVFRDGKQVKGEWSDPTASGPIRLTTKTGATIPLTPGRTWVEVYPEVKPVVVTESVPVAVTTTTGG